MNALHVSGQRHAVPELLAALPAEVWIRLCVLFLVLDKVGVRAEPFGAVGALEGLVARVFPLVSDETLQTGEGRRAVRTFERRDGVVGVDVMLVKGLENREVRLAPIALERRVGFLVHGQRFRVTYQFHTHLAVERVVGLFVGIQRRLVLEGLVAFVASETVLHVVRVLRIYLLLCVANVPHMEPKCLPALELDPALRTAERTIHTGLTFVWAFVPRLPGGLLYFDVTGVLGSVVWRITSRESFINNPTG